VRETRQHFFRANVDQLSIPILPARHHQTVLCSTPLGRGRSRFPAASRGVKQRVHREASHCCFVKPVALLLYC
jgi:hypothetical protein